MNRLDAFCDAIREFEGWFPGSTSYRNNNPGNLRRSPLAIGIDIRGYAIFKTFADGWNALVRDVTIKATGRSKAWHDADGDKVLDPGEEITPEDSLFEFFAVYAPSADGNYPRKYALFVAKRCGLTAETPIKELMKEGPA